jgi:type II secretion system protein N
MRVHTKTLCWAGAAGWFLVLLILALYLFFPYGKVFKIAFQNIVTANNMTVSFVDARLGFMKAEASKLVVGHDSFAGRPIFELEKVRFSCNPVSVFKGTLDLFSDASVYGGTLSFSIKDIPVVANTTPREIITLTGIDLSRYPEGRLKWFKGMSGILSGRITKDLAVLAQEQQKGNFSFSIRNGEIKEIAARDFPKFIVPFKEISVGGKIRGESISIEKVEITSPDITVKGSGVVEGSDLERRINMKLAYETTSKAALLTGRGIISITGNLWSPDIVVTPEDRKAAAPKK